MNYGYNAEPNAGENQQTLALGDASQEHRHVYAED